MDWNTELYFASCSLWEHLTSAPPPAPADHQAWDRLERTAWRMFGRAGDILDGSPGLRKRRLRSLMRDSLRCMDILKHVTPTPVSLRAILLLGAVTDWMRVGAETLPDVFVH